MNMGHFGVMCLALLCRGILKVTWAWDFILGMATRVPKENNHLQREVELTDEAMVILSMKPLLKRERNSCKAHNKEREEERG